MIDERYFTKDMEYVDVYDNFSWKKVDVEIKDYSTGNIIFEGHDLEFPEHYSQQACDIIASKYFYRNIDGKGTPETSLKQVVHRMVLFWTDALIEEGLIKGGWNDFYHKDSCINGFIGESEIFYDECVYTLLSQMWAPNSPQWFNSGIRLAYGIKGESDDMYWCDGDGVHESVDRYTRSQTSACFIIPVTDHLMGKNSITDHFVTETKLFKGGSGVGTNFSPLRAEGERLSSGGKSSGVMSFLLGLDRNAGAIKSGGTTRRAAKMVILDIDHPDIEEFINWKVHEEKKAKDLISLGYDGSLNGEAYQTVSGQNSNNSVRVTKEFMDKVLGNDPDPMFELKGRKDNSLNRKVNVHDLWEQIAKAAWECGDPAIQFDDKYNEWHTAPNAGRINATNPCSEYAFIDNSACNLASINLEKFLDQYNFFDYTDFRHQIELCQMVLEASIYWGQFPTPEVAENTYKHRATGLGFCNLGSVLLKQKIPYDSQQALDLAEKLSAYLTEGSFMTSCFMAKEIGACEGYEDNKEALIDVLERMRDMTPVDSTERDNFNILIPAIELFGVRNMQTTVLAPTGTISLAMDCGATGIEPFFSHKLYKKCSDGSMMEMTNPLADEFIRDCCTNFNYQLNIEDYEKVNDYFNTHGTYQGCNELADEDQKVLQTANEIKPAAHVRMMSSLQKFITGSISKTVNLPKDSTVEDIKDIYEYAYRWGCKSISVYRDGSKNAQPLNVTKSVTDDESCVHIAKYDDYQEFLEKPEFLTTTIELDVADNQNIDIQASQEYIWISSNKPINAQNKEELVLPVDKDNIVFVADKEEPVEVYAEFKECEDDLDYITATEVESDNPQLFSCNIEDGQNIFVKREDNTVSIRSNQKIDPVVEDDPFYSEENQQALKESLEDDRYIHVAVPEEIVNQKIERKKPDGIRLGVTHTARIGNVELYVTVSYYDDESLCEVFVSSDKEGTTIKGLLSSLSKAISHMLQYGIKPADIATMLRNQQYEPAGHVERHPYIKMCTSISDFIARVIEYETWDFSRCQIKPTEKDLFKHVHLKDEDETTIMIVDEEGNQFINEDLIDYDAEYKLKDPVTSVQDVIYTGSECSVCHGTRMIQNGTCELCLDCGNTSGCS